MYRIARIGGDPEQTGLEVSEHGLLIAWPWLGVLGLLQMLGKWGDGGERLSRRPRPSNGHVLVPIVIGIFFAHRSPIIICGTLPYAGLQRLQYRYGYLIVRRFGIAHL
jgi:hypothetical protein